MITITKIMLTITKIKTSMTMIMTRINLPCSAVATTEEANSSYRWQTSSFVNITIIFRIIQAAQATNIILCIILILLSYNYLRTGRHYLILLETRPSHDYDPASVTKWAKQLRSSWYWWSPSWQSIMIMMTMTLCYHHDNQGL